MATFFVGLVLGIGATVLYFRFGSHVYFIGEQLYEKVDGDVNAAYAHIDAYVKKVVSDVRNDFPF